jgi:threonine synthase
MTCAVLVPEGKIAAGKLAQALIYGARVISLNGNFDVALKLVREIAESHPISLVNSVNDFRIEGQKTASFEIVDEIGAIDLLCIPVGNAGNITAYWKGFVEYRDGLGVAAPELNGYQAAGAAPLVLGKPVENPETVASAIRIGNPARWEEAMTAITESSGAVRAVTDAEILDAYKWLPANEGVFCEPASAASVAGLLKNGISDAARASAEGARPKVVCVLTGNGLKDPDTAFDNVGSVIPCEPELGQLEKAVLG